MRREYEFDKMQACKNPYANRLERQVTIRFGEDVIAWFEQMAEEAGVPFQDLINLTLRDCVQNGRKLSMRWG